MNSFFFFLKRQILLESSYAGTRRTGKRKAITKEEETATYLLPLPTKQKQPQLL
jgi:hypothetical protein